VSKVFPNFIKANELLEGNVSIYLDLIRGISAILVVMEHLSSRLFVGYGNVENQNLFVMFLYLLNILGGPAVIIFFVLSGLFISRSILKTVYENKWSWKSYLINRLSRLLVVLIPALVLTLVLDNISTNYFGYDGYKNPSINLIEFVGNIFFLQNIFVGVYGSNAPLWSLNYEFWYYMLLPILLQLFFYKQKIIVKTIFLFIALIIISTIGTRMSSYFLIWLIGMIVLLLPKINIFKKGILPAVLAQILFFAVTPVRPLMMTGRLFTETWTEDLFTIDLIIGLAFGFFIYTLLHCLPPKIRSINLGWLGRISKLIAGFSFSLYLIHYPIINTVYHLCAKNGFTGFQPNLLSIILEVLIVIAICFIAYLFSQITEAKTHDIRIFLEEKTGSILGSRRNRVISKQSDVG
jgi:peptidoglycan/LPS O-acetylase OafA/YrhL